MKNKEIKAGAGYTVGNILVKGVSFLSLPVFTRVLSTEDFGYYNTYIAYEAIITIIIGLGMHASIKNAQYDFPERVNLFVSTQLVAVSVISIILLLTVCCVSKSLEILTGFPTVILICLVLQSFGTATLNVLNARLTLDYNYIKYLMYAGINTISNITISLILIFTLFNKDRLLGRIIGSAVPLFFIGIQIFFSEYKKIKKHFNKKMFLYAFSFGVPLIWHYLSQQVTSQFDRIMITKMVGPFYTGIYSFVYSIANIFTILFYSTDNVWSVWLFKEMNRENYANIRKKAYEYMLLVSGIACIMMFSSKEIIMIMGTKKYLSGSGIFIPVIIGMFFLFLYTIPAGIEYYFKETKYIGATTLVSAILNIVLNYIFIGIYGYKAAAYTTAVSYFIMFVSHWIISGKILKKHNIQPFFKIKDFILTSSMVIAVGGIVVLLNNHIVVKYALFILMTVALLIKYKKIIKEKIKNYIVIK